MYDIKFINKSMDIRNRIVNGELSRRDVVTIEKQMEQSRSLTPHVFNIETTNYCNMTCVMCPRTTMMTRDNQWINKNTFEKVLNQITAHKESDLEAFWNFVNNNYEITFNERSENAFYFYIVSKCVILHGYGEPLIDKNIVEHVQSCTNRNIPTYFSCVPANISVERAGKVMSAGLSVLKFSIDGLTDEDQEKVRGKNNNFEKSYKTILEILKIKKQKGYKTLIVPTMIALSDDKDAQSMYANFIELWEGHDVFAYIKSQDNRWYFEGDDELLNKSHYEQQYCEYPWSSMTVMADGSVVPCTQDYNCEMTLGNVNEESLSDIWNSKKYKDFRNWHITGNFPKGHKCLSRCDQKKVYSRLR